MNAIFSSLTLLLFIRCVYGVSLEMTVSIEAGREDCFFQTAKAGDVIDFEYQVIDGGHGDLDITFHLVDPTGRILVADFKKSEDNHRVDAQHAGDYRLCFDNTFSSFNSKTVFFEIIIENDDDSEWGSEENFQGLQPDDVYEIKIQDIHEVMNNVRSQLTKMRHVQDLLKSTEARDRNMAEENFFKVNTFSMIQIFVMIAVGIIQVVMVRSLFDDNSKAHKIWKSFNR